MTNSVIKLSSVFIIFFISAMVNAQKDFQGKAYYESRTTMDMSNFGSDMTEERKKQIADRMKSMLEKTYVLTFNQSESIYKEEEKLEAPGTGGGGGWSAMMSSFTGGPQYKDVKNKVLLQEQDFFGKQFLIKDSLPALKWKMSGETKQIGQYMCFKATATKAVEASGITSFRRPSRDEENDADKPTTKDIEVVAWYTMQIPVNQGPDDYWGLPGLILEINADRTTILCSKIILNPDVKEVIKVPSKGKEITKEDYTAVVKKKTVEMRQNFRNSGGGGNGGGGRR